MRIYNRSFRAEDINGRPAAGAHVTLWDAVTGGTQITTGIEDLTGTPIAGGLLLCDAWGYAPAFQDTMDRADIWAIGSDSGVIDGVERVHLEPDDGDARLDAFEASVGQVGGPAGPLDADGLVPSAQIPGGGGGGGPSLSGTVTAETAYGASSAAGSASTASRGDHTHGTPSLSSSAASASAVGDSAAAGSATVPARGDHVHGREAFATPGASAVADTAAAGSAATSARSDHRHGRESFGSATAQTSFGASSGNGSASTPARSDHTHGTPAAPTASSVGAVAVAGGSIITIPEGDTTTEALAIRLPTGDRTAGGAPDSAGFYVNTGTALSPTWTRTGYFNEYGMPRVISIADSQTPWRVKAHSATQSANLTEWTDINNVALSWVDAIGRMRAPNLGKTWALSLPGTLTISTGKGRIYNDTGVTLTIRSVRASVGTAPTGASLIVDVNKNGTTIFTTQANRPTVAISGNTSGKVTNMDVTTLADGDYITVDIDQIGSTVAGADLVVQVEVY
ncbi:MAG: hypothetical protein ACRDP6_14645 [Actinoallomurus sp.]